MDPVANNLRLLFLATTKFSDFVWELILAILSTFIEHLLDEITYSGTQLILAST